MAVHLPYYAGGHAGRMPTVAPPVKHPAPMLCSCLKIGMLGHPLARPEPPRRRQYESFSRPGWNDGRTGFTLLAVQRLVISDSVWEAFCRDVDNAPLPRQDDAGTQDARTGATLTAGQVASHRELNRRVRASDPARY